MSLGTVDGIAIEDEYDDDDDEYSRLACTRCAGEGFAQVDDPLWDECDEFGEGPCPACGGTGDRDKQTVF